MKKYSVEFADEQPLTFLVDRHPWILTAIYLDEQAEVCKLEGKYSERHPGREEFDPSQVRDSTKIIDKVREIVQIFLGDTEYDGYVRAFAGGHKRGCPMAMPEIGEKFPEHREDMKMVLKKRQKMKQSDVESIDIEAKMRATLCTCNNASRG